MFDILKTNGQIEQIEEKDICKQGKTILYFYPKDNTPWCTTEAKDFTALKDEFDKLWYYIVWVSKDNINSHEKFREKQELNIDLISDPELILHKKFWTYWEKNNYWKIIMWVIRSTFILDKDCNIIKPYKNVRAKNHAERILKELKKENL